MARQDFTRDEKTYWATVKMVEIIGEAARHIPAEVRALMPNVPWSQITAARNVFSHGYFGINDDILWEIVQYRVPELERELTDFLSQQKKGE